MTTKKQVMHIFQQLSPVNFHELCHTGWLFFSRCGTVWTASGLEPQLCWHWESGVIGKSSLGDLKIKLWHGVFMLKLKTVTNPYTDYEREIKGVIWRHCVYSDWVSTEKPLKHCANAHGTDSLLSNWSRKINFRSLVLPLGHFLCET